MSARSVQRRIRPVTVSVEPQPAQVTVATGHGLSFWAVLVIAALLTALVGATGHWSQGFFVAVLVLVLVGALWPPAALLVGGAALLYLTLTHGRQFIANVGALVSPPGQQSPGGQQP